MTDPRTLLPVLLVLLAAGCGLKGDLYLPDEPEPGEAPAAAEERQDAD